MSDLTGKFTGLESQMTSEHDETQTTIDNIYALLGAMSDTLTTIQNNNAANTRYLIQAIGQINPCADCEQSVTVPPIDTTTRTINTDKCKRAQAFVDAIGRIIAVWDTFSTFDLAANFTLITSSISEVIAGIAAGDTIPLPSFPEAVQLAGSVASYTGYNLFAHTSLVAEYDPLITDLVQGIYAASTAEAGKSAFDTTIASGMSSGYLSDAVIATGYSALWNYYFDPTSLPDLSAYDGLVCTDGCITFTSQAVALSCGGSSGVVVWEDPFVGVLHDGAGCSAAGGVLTNTDLMPYIITPTANVRLFTGGGGFHDINAGISYQHGSGTHHAAIVYLSGSLPFDVTLCLA